MKALSTALAISLALSGCAPQLTVPMMQRRADRGNAEAAYRVGVAYMYGEGVRRDVGAGWRYLSQSSSRGYLPAIQALAFEQLPGGSLPRNPVQALRLFEMGGSLSRTPEQRAYFNDQARQLTNYIRAEQARRERANEQANAAAAAQAAGALLLLITGAVAVGAVLRDSNSGSGTAPSSGRPMNPAVDDDDGLSEGLARIDESNKAVEAERRRMLEQKERAQQEERDRLAKQRR